MSMTWGWMSWMASQKRHRQDTPPTQHTQALVGAQISQPLFPTRWEGCRQWRRRGSWWGVPLSPNHSACLLREASLWMGWKTVYPPPRPLQGGAQAVTLTLGQLPAPPLHHLGGGGMHVSQTCMGGAHLPRPRDCCSATERERLQGEYLASWAVGLGAPPPATPLTCR